jgi:hypothetical protein
MTPTLATSYIKLNLNIRGREIQHDLCTWVMLHRLINRQTLPQVHRLVACASYPAAHSVHEFILKNHPSLFLSLPPPLVQHLVAIPVLDVDAPSPCYCCCRPIRHCSLTPIARASHPFSSRVLVLVVLAPPIARATHPTEPSLVLVILVAVVLVRAACAGC